MVIVAMQLFLKGLAMSSGSHQNVKIIMVDCEQYFSFSNNCFVTVLSTLGTNEICIVIVIKLNSKSASLTQEVAENLGFESNETVSSRSRCNGVCFVSEKSTKCS